MSQANQIIKDIKNKHLKPIYFLQGEEPYYIDKISKVIESEVLSEDEKGFNQTVIYGNETDISGIIGIAKQYPMGSQYSVVIVKEAQHLSRTIEQLESYALQPQPTTVLVINYKGKTLDKRKKLHKSLVKSGLIFDSPKMYDNQIPAWIEEKIAELGNKIEPKAKFILAEYVGADLSRLENELEKLSMIVGKGNIITPHHIEENIGISKDYNVFEFRKAIETKDITKAFKIAKYYQQNPRDNPLVVTIGILYSLFSSLIVLHTLADKSPGSIARELKVNPYFVKDYLSAAHNYPLKKVTRIISHIREADVKSKGIGSTGNVSESDLLRELIYKIVAE